MKNVPCQLVYLPFQQTIESKESCYNSGGQSRLQVIDSPYKRYVLPEENYIALMRIIDPDFISYVFAY